MSLSPVSGSSTLIFNQTEGGIVKYLLATDPTLAGTSLTIIGPDPISITEVVKDKTSKNYLNNLFNTWKLDRKLSLVDLMGVDLSSHLMKIEEITSQFFRKEIAGEISDLVDQFHQCWQYIYLRGSAVRHQNTDESFKFCLSVAARFPPLSKLSEYFKQISEFEKLLKKPRADRQGTLDSKIQKDYEDMVSSFAHYSRGIRCFNDLIEVDSTENTALKFLTHLSLDEIAGTDLIENGTGKKVVKDVFQYAKFVSRIYLPKVTGRLGVGLSLSTFRGVSEDLIQVASKQPLDLDLFRKKMRTLFASANVGDVSRNLLKILSAVADGSATRSDVFGPSAAAHFPKDIKKEREDLYALIMSQVISCNLLQSFTSDVIRIIDSLIQSKKCSQHRTIESYAQEMIVNIAVIHQHWEFGQVEKSNLLHELMKEIYGKFQNTIDKAKIDEFLNWYISQSVLVGQRLPMIREYIEKEFSAPVCVLAEKGPIAFQRARRKIEEEVCKYTDYDCSVKELAQWYRMEVARAALPVIRIISLIRSMHIVGFLGEKSLPNIEHGINLLPEELIDLLNLQGLEEKIEQSRQSAPSSEVPVAESEPIPDVLPKSTVSDSSEIKLQVASGDKVTKLSKWFVDNGFIAREGKGSHLIFTYPATGMSAVVPRHKHLKPGTASSVAAQAEAAMKGIESKGP